jgi:antitoxin YefM
MSMAVETSDTNLRKNLRALLDRVVDDRETVIVRRRSGRDVAMLPASALDGLMETAHLLRSPNNALLLLTTLKRAERGKGRPSSVERLRRAAGLDAG